MSRSPLRLSVHTTMLPAMSGPACPPISMHTGKTVGAAWAAAAAPPPRRPPAPRRRRTRLTSGPGNATTRWSWLPLLVGPHSPHSTRCTAGFPRRGGQPSGDDPPQRRLDGGRAAGEAGQAAARFFVHVQIAAQLDHDSMDAPVVAQVRQGHQGAGERAVEGDAGSGLAGIAFDRPFAGALVPLPYLGNDRRIHAVMIELRRDLYMDEETGGRLAGFAGYAAAVQAALRRIIA